MNDFTYHNIFETKGFEYIITIIFFALLIPFWILLNRKVKVREQVVAVKGILNAAMLQVPGGLFVNRNHTWAFLERSGFAKIGLDTLLVHLTGNINIQYFKEKGDKVEKGELIAKLLKEDKQLEIYSPISGTVGNKNLFENQVVNQLANDPYGSGWLMEIEPDNWSKETQKLYLGTKALDWLKTELDRFKDFLANSAQGQLEGETSLVLQDGGELMDQTLSEMSKEVWANFQKEFLNQTI